MERLVDGREQFEDEPAETLPATFAECNTQAARIAFLKVKLATDSAWTLRGLIAIYRYQTEEEQSSDATTHHNNRGFTGPDAFILSQFAKQAIAWGKETNPRFAFPLSPKQLALCQRKMPRYARQLERIATGKQ